MRNFSKAMLNNDGMQMLAMQESLRYCMVSNSTALITDATSAATAVYSATAVAAAIAAAGPIMDLAGTLDLVLAKFQEAKEILAYVLEGKQTSSNLTGPTGGPITSGADGTTYNKLVGIYQILV